MQRGHEVHGTFRRRRLWLLALAPFLLAGAHAPRIVPLPPPSPAFAPPATEVLFADDFSRGIGAWRADRPGVWSVERGMLRAVLPDRKQQRSLLWTAGPEWRDIALEFDVCMVRGVDKGAVVRAHGETGIGIDLRGGRFQDVLAYAGEWPIGRAAAAAADSAWHHVRITVAGDRVRVAVDGAVRLDCRQGRVPQGRVALAAYTGGAGACVVWYDNIVVTAP